MIKISKQAKINQKKEQKIRMHGENLIHVCMYESFYFIFSIILIDFNGRTLFPVGQFLVL